MTLVATLVFATNAAAIWGIPEWPAPATFTGGGGGQTFCDSDFTGLCFTAHYEGIHAYRIAADGGGAAGTMKWQWTAPAGTTLQMAPPVQLGGCRAACEYLFVAASDGHLYKIQAQTGAMVGPPADLRRYSDGILVCQVAPGDGLSATPTLQLFNFSNSAFQIAMSASGHPGDSLVTVITHNGCGDTTHNRVYALYASDLSIRWIFNAGGPQSVDAGYAGCTLNYSSNRLYCTTDLADGAVGQNSLFAFSSISGQLIWSHNAGPILNRAAFNHGQTRLYVANNDGWLMAYSPDGDGFGGGVPLWASPVYVVWSGAVVQQDIAVDTRPDGLGQIYVLDSGGVLHAAHDDGSSATHAWAEVPDCIYFEHCDSTDLARSAPVFERVRCNIYIGMDDGTIVEMRPAAIDGISGGGAAVGDEIPGGIDVRHVSLDRSFPHGPFNRLMGTSTAGQVNRFAIPWLTSCNMPSAGVSVTKTAPAQAEPGAIFNYDLTITNGASWALDVTVTDLLPAGLVLDSVTVSQGAVEVYSGPSEVVAYLGDMAPNATASAQISVFYPSAVCGTVDNTALVHVGNGNINSASASTYVCSLPAAPTNLNATANGQTQIDLQWTDNSDDESGFKVERSPADAGTWTLLTTTAANATSYSDTSLPCGTAYDYRVMATNAAGDSLPATDSATTDACPPPILTVTGSGTGDGTMTAAGSINCASIAGVPSGDCSEQPTLGTEFAITATTDVNSTFTGWAGCDSTSGLDNEICHVALVADTTVTANFELTYELLTKGDGAGSGTMSGFGIECASTEAVTSGDCDEQAASGTVFVITAAPNAGSDFADWAGCDSTSGDNNEICHITLTADLTVAATFILNPTLTVAGSGTGSGTMTDSGVDCSSTAGVEAGDCSDQPVSGTVFAITATATGGSVFGGWLGCDSTSGVNNEICHVTLTADITVTATFNANPVLTVTGSGTGSGTMTDSGIDCISAAGIESGDCSEQATSETVFAITATSSVYSAFAGWTGCDSTSGLDNQICNLTLTADRSVSAAFDAYPILTVEGSGLGSGAVIDQSSSGADVNCDIVQGVASGDCAEPYAVSKDVTLIATPAAGSYVAGWTGCDSVNGTFGEECYVQLMGERAVTLDLDTIGLTVSGAGAGSGTMSATGIACISTAGVETGDCSEDGVSSSVTAIADAGSVFTGWTGCDSTSGANNEICHIALASDTTVIATFDVIPVINLVTNGGMETDANVDKIPDNWKKSTSINTNNDKQDCLTLAHGGSCSFTIKGNGNSKKLTQSKSFSVALAKGTPFTFSVWVQTSGVPGSGPFAQVKLTYTDLTTKVVKLTIPAGTLAWTPYTVSFTGSASKKIKKVTVTLLYNKGSGFIWFDDVSLTTP